MSAAVVLIGHTLGSAFSVPTSYEVSVKQVCAYAFMSRNCKGNVCAHPAGTSDVTTAQITSVDWTLGFAKVAPGLVPPIFLSTIRSRKYTDVMLTLHVFTERVQGSFQ